ncbi:MAG TPA: 50S ribosomal protein L23 [Candidatus Pacearchaeota archaeon]|nr:50S ribosomal protein L23 [Candidatus Pacearchaeota archaeon]
MKLKSVVTEKAVMMIEKKNVLVFVTEKEAKKEDVKKEIEDIFKVKVSKVRTLIRGNKKYSYVTLDKKNPAIDVATKLGII